MGVFGVIVTILIVLASLRLIGFVLNVRHAIRRDREQYQDDKKTAGGLVFLLLIFLLAFSSSDSK